jgi:hypothetical protein
VLFQSSSTLEIIVGFTRSRKAKLLVCSRTFVPSIWCTSVDAPLLRLSLLQGHRQRVLLASAVLCAHITGDYWRVLPRVHSCFLESLFRVLVNARLHANPRGSCVPRHAAL